MDPEEEESHRCQTQLKTKLPLDGELLIMKSQVRSPITYSQPAEKLQPCSHLFCNSVTTENGLTFTIPAEKAKYVQNKTQISENKVGVYL